MKKRSLLFVVFCIITTVLFAQTSVCVNPLPSIESSKVYKSYNLSFAKSAPFWSEDFSGGIPATWTNGSTPTPPVISAPWVYRGPGTNPGVGTGSQGAYAGTNGAIASPTASNGFVIFDSDYYDNGGTAGNFGAGPYPCNSITGGSPTGHVGTLTTDSIDCSMYSDVTILFNSFYREYTGIAKMAFSIDGGVTFTDTVEVHPDIEVNERTENDYQVMVRMPFNIAGNSNVQMQFIYDGTVLYSVYNGYYFWMIDDIELIETPAHLINISDPDHGGWLTSSPTTTGDMGVNYTFNPIKQATANPYRFASVVTNDGAQSQTNTTFYVNVDQGGSSVFSASSTPINLYPNTDSVLSTSTYTPVTTGLHEVTFWASSDSFPMTSTLSLSTNVTDTVYAVDLDLASDGSGAENGYFLGRSCGGQVLANAFEIYDTDTVTSISFHVNDQSVPGAIVQVELYEYDVTVASPTPVFLVGSDDYVITQADLNSWVTVGLASPTFVGPGLSGPLAYLAAVKGTPHPIDTSLISSSSTDNTASYIQDNGCDIGSGAAGTWYSASKSLLIRMNLGNPPPPPVSINDKIYSGDIVISPNPSQGVFNVNLANILPGEYKIDVLNVLGEVVYSIVEDSRTNLNTKIDLSGFDKGMYLINVINDINSVTQRVIIE